MTARDFILLRPHKSQLYESCRLYVVFIFAEYIVCVTEAVESLLTGQWTYRPGSMS